MFTHAGPRSFSAAIVFLPWLLLGVGYLVSAARHKLHRMPASPRERVMALQPSRARRLHTMGLAGLLLLAATRVVIADPGESRACEATTPEEARLLADRLNEHGDYQHAGVCYQAAGDLVHANLAFLQAAGPASEDSARDLKAQRDTAKALFSGVAQAFKARH